MLNWLIRAISVLFVCCAGFVFCSATQSAPRGGYSTVFDPASDGGNWPCFRTLASGTCGGATAKYYNAACDGTTDDATAWNNWIADSVASNPTLAKLYIPPGSQCVVSNAAFYLTGGSCCDNTVPGIKNAKIWGYGSTLINTVGDCCQYFIGGQGFYADTTHHALIQTTNVGDTSVVVTDGNVGRFSVDDWASVDCISLQPTSGPVNLYYFDYVQITGIVGNTVSFSPSLTNACKSTYPEFLSDFPPSGAATLHKMQPQWDQKVHVLGINFASTKGSTALAGRDITLQDAKFPTKVGTFTGPSPSNAMNVSVIGTYWAISEIDKDVTNLTITGGGAVEFVIASATIRNMTIRNFTFWGALTGFPLNGTAYNTTLSNVAFPDNPSQAIGVGAGFGLSQSIILNNVTFGTQGNQKQNITASTLSYSAGVFSIALGSADALRELAVPGAKLFFASAVDAHCSPDVYFTITDISADASNFYATTGNWVSGGSPIATPGTLPTPCSGGPASIYQEWATLSASQINSGPGTITQFAAPP